VIATLFLGRQLKQSSLHVQLYEKIGLIKSPGGRVYPSHPAVYRNVVTVSKSIFFYFLKNNTLYFEKIIFSIFKISLCNYGNPKRLKFVCFWVFFWPSYFEFQDAQKRFWLEIVLIYDHFCVPHILY